jgi:transcriptional regulator with XRE-family HTH domain
VTCSGALRRSTGLHILPQRRNALGYDGCVTSETEEPAQRPDYPRIGGHLRESRQARNLSLRELAQLLGVSPSLISQIETGRANPSVSTLYAIATELDVSLDELLFGDRRTASLSTATEPGAPPDQKLQRADSRKSIRLASGVVWERLTPLSEPGVEFLYVTYEVNGASSPNGSFQRHEGHEWGYVLEGRLEVKIGFDEYILEPGDAISYDSPVPHRLANVGDSPVHAIWFVLGRQPTGGDESGTDLHASADSRMASSRHPRRGRARWPTSVQRSGDPR